MPASARQLFASIFFSTISLGVLATAPLMVDGDADGVSDEIDECPYTHQGIRVDVLGCPLQREDVDLDGVPDVDDDCPYSPEAAVVDARGCALDTDFDGVANGLDRCPKTALSQTIDAAGCAKGEKRDVVLSSDKAMPKDKPVTVRLAAPPKAVSAMESVPVSALPMSAAAPPQFSMPSVAAPIIVAATPIAQPEKSKPESASPLGVATVQSKQVPSQAVEVPRLELRFLAGSARLGVSDLSNTQSYARLFARSLSANSASSLALKAYADIGEPGAAALAALRLTNVREKLIESGVAASRIRAETLVLDAGPAASNRRVEAEVSDN